jgi:PAS domain S-box-containing protein
VEVIKTPLRDVSGAVTGIQGIFWDVTERKRLQDALAYERDLLQALLDHSPDVIFFKDPRSRFVKVGRSAARWFNVADAEELVGKTVFDLMPAALAQPLHDEEQELLRTGQPIINKLQQYGESQGRQPWASVTKIPIYDRTGAILGLVGVARDITQLIETEQVAGRRSGSGDLREIEASSRRRPRGDSCRSTPRWPIYGYGSRRGVNTPPMCGHWCTWIPAPRAVRGCSPPPASPGSESEIYCGRRPPGCRRARIVRDPRAPGIFRGTLEASRRKIGRARVAARRRSGRRG